jgi:tetrahydromethanopterin S-methyltransferase subunit C
LITVFILVYAAKAPMLSDIPASVLGYAATAGLALAGNKLGAVTTASLENPFINIVISLIIGAVLGYISQKIALALVKE